MAETLTMGGWLLAGAAASKATAPPDSTWWRWMPMAVLFGPMWFFIATEQRQAAETAAAFEPE